MDRGCDRCGAVVQLHPEVERIVDAIDEALNSATPPDVPRQALCGLCAAEPEGIDWEKFIDIEVPA